MDFRWIASSFSSHITTIYSLMVVIIYETINFHEQYILEQVKLAKKKPEEYFHEPGNYSRECVHRNTKPNENIKQNTWFYWTEEQKVSFTIIYNCSQMFTELLGGIYSDKYGGQRVVLVGLILCSLVMSTSYLSMYNNNYVFISMLGLRRASYGLIWAAFFSIAGKVAMSNSRTIYVLLIVSGQPVGKLIGFAVLRLVVKWRTISQVSGFLAFITAVWWWMVYRMARFPKVPRTTHIPWVKLTTSVSLYAICPLVAACYILKFVTTEGYETYAKFVISIHESRDWIVKIMIYSASFFGYLFCGLSSDYIISQGYLHASTVRRIFIGLCVISLFCTVVVIKLVGCNIVAVIGCLIVLRITESIAWSTSVASILDFAPSCSGIVVGIVFSFSHLLKLPAPWILVHVFVSGYSDGDINMWSDLFFTAAFLVFVFSLFFIFFGLKESSVDTHFQIIREDAEIEPAVSKNQSMHAVSASQPMPAVGKQQSLQDTDPSLTPVMGFSWFHSLFLIPEKP